MEIMRSNSFLLSILSNFLWLTIVIAQQTSPSPFYFDNVTFITENNQPCRVNNAISETSSTCRAVLIPGGVVTIKWIQLPPSNASVVLKSIYLCEDKTRTIKTDLTVYARNATSIYTVPGKSKTSRIANCTKNMQPTMQFEMCVYLSDISYIYTDFSDYTLATSCTHTFVNVDIKAAGIPLITLPPVQDNYAPAIIFAIAFGTTAVCWLLVMFVSYRQNTNVYREISETMENEALTPNYVNHRTKILYNLVHKKPFEDIHPQLKEKMMRFASGFEKVSAVAEQVGKMNVQTRSIEFFVNEDFYGRPAQTRIQKLGQSGYSWRMLALLFPWKLLKVGKSTLTLRRDDELFLLPKYFTLRVAYRTSLQFLTVLVVISGLLLYRLSPSLFRPDTFGFIWIFAGLLLFFMLNRLNSDFQSDKGMLKLLRSIGEPRIPEIMFSYNWGFQKDSIRTLAHALWNTGIGVWIDYIKLISGDKLPQDIRRAAKEVNLIVVFLTPLYLSSGNCCIEFEEAIKQPGKLHIHVLKWDETVLQASRFLIDDIKVPYCNITSHSGGREGGFFKNLMKSGKSYVYSDSQTDRFIQKLETQGNGWMEFSYVLHNYSKKDGDTWDFSWWLMNANSGGGIPDNAPLPAKVHKWNLRPFFPPTKLPTLYDIRHQNQAVNVGNVYLSEDCRKTGANGSVIPWKLFLFTLIGLFPLLDIYLFYIAEAKLHTFTDECVADAKSSISDNRVFDSVCAKFYESELYRGNSSNLLSESAFRMEYVNKAFVKLTKSTDCSGSRGKSTNLVAIEEVLSCVSDLSTWFADNGYIADKMIWTLMLAISVSLLITVAMNSKAILDTSHRIPACLRPLLAVSNLKRKSSPKKKAMFRSRHPQPPRSEEIHIDVLQEPSGSRRDGGLKPRTMTHFRKRMPPIPSLYVRVHGHGLIADNLRTFLHNLGRILPPNVQCPDVFDAINPTYVQPVPNAAKIDDDGFAWVNVFVISSQRDLNLFYHLNYSGKIDLEVSVVVVDHQPIPGIVRFSDFKNMSDNILKISEASLWLFTVVFIETRMRENVVGILKDYPTPELADQIMVNISLRTKDALFKYGHFFLSALKAH
ncbi:hypothetical protein HK098_005233 [Nowakowskiella sp. JEL0407]|nr:hypothetical protein HK098_005233 [Nowakowskiella sp. JEL0407]